jgi:predicted unusual protein kinase regulating ubiquinone biosynthesis (AarF/ABC1/UbiB family)
MSEEACRRVLQEELGAEPESLFDEWEPQPFASASIGQVHRAVLDGQRVAVKVQLEGVARAVQSDLANASLLTGLVPFAGKLKAKEQFEELRARFLEELDYEVEARRQRRFAAVFAADSRVRVPRVLDQRSTRRVLTSEFAEGLDFEAACAASESERRAWAETLWRFVFESILGHGMFNADPHPGNYRFGSDGQVTFLDFGCVKELSPEQTAVVRANHRLVAAARFDEFVPRMLSMLGLRTTGVVAEVSGSFVIGAMRPIWHQGPFHLTRDFAAGLAKEMATKQGELRRLAAAEIEAPAPDWLFFNRLQLGFYSVLARLDVAVDYGAVHREILSRY